MVNILLNGCCGRMGQAITRLAECRDDLKVIAGIDIRDNGKCPYPVFTSPTTAKSFIDTKQGQDKVDVIIDFSNPDALKSVTDLAATAGKALIVATTGLSPEQREMLKTVSGKIPLFYSANMSLGINLLISLAKKAAEVLGAGFDIEIIEKHHNQKIDAPSGTAIAIADALNSDTDKPSQKYEYIYERHSRRAKRPAGEIGIHSVRGGTIAGEHTIIYAGNDEVLEISHQAASRDIFAAGALRAALFIAGKAPGFYGMNDVLSL